MPEKKVLPLEEAEEIPHYMKPVMRKFKIIEDKSVEWSLFKRINFYVEWTPRIINEGNYELGREYFGGLKGDLITYMITRGYDKEVVENVKRMIARIENVLNNGAYNSGEKKYLFLKYYRDFVNFLSECGLYLSVRFQKPKTNEEIVNAIENMIINIDEIEKDLLQGGEVKDDMSLALQNLATLISSYKTDDTKLSFLKIEVVNKIREVKSRVGIVQKDKPTTLETFSREYAEMMNSINRFLSAVKNEDFVETYYKYYAKKTFNIPEKQAEKEEIAELFMKVLLEDRNVDEFLKNKIKEAIQEMAEEEGEGESAEEEAI